MNCVLCKQKIKGKKQRVLIWMDTLNSPTQLDTIGEKVAIHKDCLGKKDAIFVWVESDNEKVSHILIVN